MVCGAPGGLLKALKIVYGFHDENVHVAEMKALDRVKELRHPFLLSLERIEIFENQLVVVTELADNSLADVFNDFTARASRAFHAKTCSNTSAVLQTHWTI